MTVETDQFERIQNYILGRMPSEERAIFEKDLVDEPFRKQYEEALLLIHSVREANQEANLRMVLEDYEKQLSESPRPSFDGLDDELARVERELASMGVPDIDPNAGAIKNSRSRFAHFLKTILQWFIPSGIPSEETANRDTVVYSLSYASRLAISFAVAASLTLAILLPHNTKLATSGYNYAPSQLELQSFRGRSSNSIEDAIDSYNKGNFDAALSYFEETRSDLKASLSLLDESDSDVITKLGYTNDLQQVEWYRALTLMKERKVSEARRALRDIAKSDSPYANEATHILKDVY